MCGENLTNRFLGVGKHGRRQKENLDLKMTMDALATLMSTWGNYRVKNCVCAIKQSIGKFF